MKTQKNRREKSQDQLVYLKKLGAHIRKVRIAQGYSQDRLALEAGPGFSRGNMAKIEKGSVDPKATTLVRIALTIGVHVKKLLDFE